MPPGISLRPITDADLPFLYEVYASTRAHEMTLVNWSDAQKEAFVRMQFEAQHAHYREHFVGATFEIIVKDRVQIGRLYLLRETPAVRIIDITLLPEHRGKGTGSAILNEIIQDAAKTRKPVQIHVEKFNPALHLYERLGFEKIADKGVYYLLEKPVKPD
jgi:ribosomal protein S18 acetylase RimI-like enzyme